MILIKVTNSSCDGLYTLAAYQELRLLMSTGDFHAHKSVSTRVINPHPDTYTDLDLLIGGI